MEYSQLRISPSSHDWLIMDAYLSELESEALRFLRIGDENDPQRDVRKTDHYRGYLKVIERLRNKVYKQENETR